MLHMVAGGVWRERVSVRLCCWEFETHGRSQWCTWWRGELGEEEFQSDFVAGNLRPMAGLIGV